MPDTALDMSRELSRRKPHQHWYRPGTDTPLGYFAAHFAFMSAILFGATGAVLGRGWHFDVHEIGLAAIDTSWLLRTLIRKRRRGRPRRALGRRARGEVLWIDTPESHTGIPLD